MKGGVGSANRYTLAGASHLRKQQTTNTSVQRSLLQAGVVWPGQEVTLLWRGVLILDIIIQLAPL